MRTAPFFLPFVLGCQGTIGTPHGSDGLDGPFDCETVCVEDPEVVPDFAPVRTGMSRLTQAQYRRILTDAFGELDFDTALEADEGTAEFSTHGAAQVTTSSRGVEQYRDAAMSLAGQI
ncbi:MAG: DUF1587 domain-containing protein, partial [Myxococcota bacterium]